MGIISIREQSTQDDGFRAVVSFDGGQEYPIAVSDPFVEDQESNLGWYFEMHLRFPFTDQVNAANVASSIATYGETLFNQVFADRQVFRRYGQALQQGLDSTRLEISGSHEFHSLHWEALKDPELPRPMALSVPIIRKNLEPAPLNAVVRDSPAINLLIVTARPGGRRDVAYRTVSGPLVGALDNSQLRVNVDLLRPGTYQALQKQLEDVGVGHYHAIHFDVHGSLLTHDQLQKVYEPNPVTMANPYGRNHIDEYDGQKGFVFLEDLENDHPDPVEAGQLGDLLINYQVPLVILNACQSGKQVSESESSLASRLMQAGVQMVVGMGYSVTVSAVEVMMESFYAQLFDGHAAADAIRRARLEMFNQKERRAYFNQRIDLEDWMLPVVYQNQDLQLTLREPTSQEQESYLIRDTQRHQAPTISYGFVGRDLDVLEVERRLISDGNILLIRGMGGIGKSTLLHHLGNWWQRTGFVDRVFYYGYDDRAWTRQQIITDIAQGLMDAVEYTRFQSLALDLQQAELVRQLRANPHLLVLDNLESVRGSPASIPNTLQPEEQDTIRGFLAALRGGRTLVLLGSRGPEEWLAQDSFGQNSHELPGLDPEAASTLADLILRRHGAEGYREDPALERLLGFLDGHPLALEVVLANLARQTPSEVLEALEVGDVDSIDTADSEEKSDKTQSILRCIEYSHGNLSPEAQGLLSCLAPFTSVVDTALLPTYSERLKEQPLLVSLPFDRWDEVLGEAVNWGLMSPDAQTSRWLRPQPIFPYFLRSRLSQPDEADFSRAVNKAFREHHAALGGALGQALQSNDPEQTQSAQQMVGLQYANLARALNLALGDKTTIINLAAPLLSYLDFRAAYAQALEIGETVLNGLDDYPAEALTGQLGIEFAGIVGEIGNRQHRLNRFEAAETSYNRVLSIVQGTRSVDEKVRGIIMASAYHQLGMTAQSLRRFEQAEQHYQNALKINNEFNDRHSQASTYHQLGVAAAEQRKFEQAEQHYQNAQQIYIEFNDRHSQATIYQELGRVAGARRQFEQAEKYYQNALKIKIEFNDRRSQAITYHQLGNVAQEQRQFKQAKQYYQNALKIDIEFNDRHSQAITYYNLGVMAVEQGQFEQARELFMKALEIFMETQDNQHLGAVLLYLARVWQESGDSSLLQDLSSLIDSTTQEVEATFRRLLEGGDNEESSSDPA